MFKAEQFTKSNLSDLRKDLDVVLSKYSKESGVHLSIGNIRFGDVEATIKLTATLPNNNNSLQTTEQEAFKRFADLDSISVKLNELGTSRNLGTVKMLGYKTRNRKYPYIVEQVSTGSRYKLSTSSARSLCPTTV
jgi:hypothetical protein